MSKFKLTNIIPILFFFIALGIFLWAGSAHATKPKPPPKPTPTQPVTQEQLQHQAQSQGQTAHGGFGEGGDSYSDVRVETGDVASESFSQADGGSSDNAVAISNVYMSRAFAQDFPITHGCFVGVNAGGDKTTQTKSTGGFLGFTYLSNSCHMQTLAAAEKDIEIVSRLQCGDRKYRNAVAFDHPKGVSKREHCIAIKKQSLMGAIELEKQKLQELADEYKTKHSEVENLLVISQEHSEVCDESLARCKVKAEGGK